MDKSEVMAGLYTPLFGDSLPAEGLGNTYWLSNQSTYENHAGDAGYGAGDIESAQAANMATLIASGDPEENCQPRTPAGPAIDRTATSNSKSVVHAMVFSSRIS